MSEHISSPAITPLEVAQIADKLQVAGLDEASLDRIRMQHPGRRFTYCSDDDIFHGKPVASRAGFHVYLVGGDEHCLSLTNDFDLATGIVVAEVIDDEEE